MHEDVVAALERDVGLEGASFACAAPAGLEKHVDEGAPRERVRPLGGHRSRGGSQICGGGTSPQPVGLARAGCVHFRLRFARRERSARPRRRAASGRAVPWPEGVAPMNPRSSPEVSRCILRRPLQAWRERARLRRAQVAPLNYSGRAPKQGVTHARLRAAFFPR